MHVNVIIPQALNGHKYKPQGQSLTT